MRFRMLAASAGEALDMLLGFFVFADGHQPREQVQAVGEFVGLGAQRIGQGPLAAQLAQGLFQLGMVGQGQGASIVLGSQHRLAAGGNQHTLSGKHVLHRFGLGGIAAQQVHQALVQDLFGLLAHSVFGKIQQPARFSVDQGEPAIAIHAQYAIADSVEHRLLCLLQRIHFFGVNPVDPADGPFHQRGRQGADGHGQDNPRRERPDDINQAGAHLALQDAHGDGANNLPLLEDRLLHPQGDAQGAFLHAPEGFAVADGFMIRGNRLADGPGIGVGHADAVQIGNGHIVHSGCRFGEVGQRGDDFGCVFGIFCQRVANRGQLGRFLGHQGDAAESAVLHPVDLEAHHDHRNCQQRDQHDG